MAGLSVSDPRQQAHLSLTYKADQPQLSATKSFELSQTYGRNLTSAGSTSHNKTKGKAVESTHFSRQRTEWEDTVHPPFLNKNSQWVQGALPTLVTQSQAQSLTTTGNLDGTRGIFQAPRAISAVHTYHDTSPVLTAEYTRDTDRSEVSWDATINKRGTSGVYKPSGPQPSSKFNAAIDSVFQQSKKAGQVVGDSVVRKSSVDAFFQRGGKSSLLKQHDIARIGDEIGSHAVPGNANAKLVGGKWRYLSRPTEGQHLFTDYYGRCAGSHCDYYGRTYHYLPQ